MLDDVVARIDSPKLVGMSLLMAALLTIAYSALYAVLHAAADER